MSNLLGIDTLHVLSTQKPKFKNAQKKNYQKAKKRFKNNIEQSIQNHIEYCEHLKLA